MTGEQRQRAKVRRERESPAPPLRGDGAPEGTAHPGEPAERQRQLGSGSAEAGVEGGERLGTPREQPPLRRKRD